MSEYYHYGLSGQIVWATHILLGIFYVYLGYLILEQKEIPNKYYGVALIVLGVLAALYHAHLWYNYSQTDKKESFRGRQRENEESDDEDD